MIKKILKLMLQKNISFSELANALKINQSELKNRFEIMVNMGYIKVIHEDDCELGFKCKSCPAANKRCNDTKAYSLNTIAYRVTAKGKRIVMR